MVYILQGAVACHWTSKGEDESRVVMDIVIEDCQKRFIVNPKKYSSYTRLVRITAWVIRFIHIIMKLSQRPDTSYLTVNEIIRAEQHLLKQAQHKDFKL